MTAEVIVMNRHALVLAADSAATVTSYSGDKEEERYFKGTNKIFQVSNHHPVGVMIFDNADIHRIPCEILIKEYRTALSGKKFPDLESYAKGFFEFIQKHNKLFSDEYRKEIAIELVDRIMIGVLTNIDEDANYRALGSDQDRSAYATQEIAERALDVLAEPSEKTGTQQYINDWKNENIAALRKEAGIDQNQFLKDASIPLDDLIEYAVNFYFKKYKKYCDTTGFVFAGYGNDEYFPNYCEYTCYGFVGDQLVYELVEQAAITPKIPGSIKPFATSRMINTFALGFSPDVFTGVRNELEPVLKDFAKKVRELDNSTIVTPVEDLVKQAVKSHSEKWIARARTLHGQPLRRVIGSLPIDEMAELAETLIMLESLKEKVTQPTESVSGPIDVAVISRADGFVWVKRKHYFDPKLNPRYFNKLRSEFEPEEPHQ